MWCARRRQPGRGGSLVGSAPVPNVAHDLGGEFGISQEFVDQRAKDLLPGDPCDAEAVGGLSLPDVKGAVGGG